MLDAKRPNQNIFSGNSVEQVYSYAIHPEIRVDLYALCNGHQLTVFHISKTEPIFQCSLKDIASKWSDLETLLSPHKILDYWICSVNLTKLEVESLKEISRFEAQNPINPPEFPTAYSVDDLATDLKINWSEANEVLKKLRRLGLVEFFCDNWTVYPNLDRPINETSPGRLSKAGQDLLKIHGSGN